MEDRNNQLLSYENEMNNILEALKLLTGEVGSYKNASKNLDAAYQTLQSLIMKLIDNLEAISSLQNEVKSLTTSELFERLDSMEEEIENNTSSSSSIEVKIQNMHGQIDNIQKLTERFHVQLQSEMQKGLSKLEQFSTETQNNVNRISVNHQSVLDKIKTEIQSIENEIDKSSTEIKDNVNENSNKLLTSMTSAQEQTMTNERTIKRLLIVVLAGLVINAAIGIASLIIN